MKLRINFNDTRQRLLTGLLVTTFVVYQLAERIMAGGSGESISLKEFLTFHNISFCFYMFAMFIAVWTMRGKNNRQVITCWLLSVISAIFIYYQLVEYFLYVSRNTYVLSFATTFSNILLVILTLQRIKIVKFCYQRLGMRAAINADLKKTKFEIYLREYVVFYFAFELLVSLTFTFYGIYYQVAPAGSLYQMMMRNGHPDFFDVYFTVQNLFTIYVSIIIMLGLIMDFLKPDNTAVNLDEEQKARFIAKLKAKSQHRK